MKTNIIVRMSADNMSPDAKNDTLRALNTIIGTMCHEYHKKYHHELIYSILDNN